MTDKVVSREQMILTALRGGDVFSINAAWCVQQDLTAAVRRADGLIRLCERKSGADGLKAQGIDVQGYKAKAQEQLREAMRAVSAWSMDVALAIRDGGMNAEAALAQEYEYRRCLTAQGGHTPGDYYHYTTVLLPFLRNLPMVKNRVEIMSPPVKNPVEVMPLAETVTIKAISLHQPWASMVAWGLKEYETRHWSVRYRGKIAICAARHCERTICHTQPFAGAIDKHNNGKIDTLPSGVIVAIADLADVVRTETIRQSLSTVERAVGNFANQRYGWQLKNVRALGEPIPVRGQQGLFDVEIARELMA